MALGAWRLLVLFQAVHLTWAKAKPIDIFNGGKGDILQLRKDSGDNSGRTIFVFFGGANFQFNRNLTQLLKEDDTLYKMVRMRNALYRNSNLKWNLRDSDGNVVIPYIVSAHYNYREKKALTEAFRRIHANTCIRFKPRTNERDFVDIQNERGEGCYTNVGRVGGRGIIMLEANYMETCMEPSIILHELMHVAGLWHEHMRSDRDNYIKVHYENISPDYWSQFEKVTPYEATTYNVPYDYKSLMHYGKRAFAKRGRISMETLDPKFQNIIGKQTDASPSDYKKICQIYGCQNCMSGSSGSGETDEDRSDDETVEDKDDTVDPVTERPILPPSGGKCVDAMAGFCSLLSSAGMLDCGFIGRARCCASCAAQDQGKSGWMDPYSLFKDFFGFRRRY